MARATALIPMLNAPNPNRLREEAKPLTYRYAIHQEKAADLINHSRSLADQARDQADRRSSLERSVSTAA